MNRRGLILLFGAAALVGGYQLAPRFWQGTFRFTPVDGLLGFRRLDGGRVSTVGFDPLAGIGQTAAAVESAGVPSDPAGLCAALFDGGGGAPVPAAFFSDYFCPYCRVLEGDLLRLQDAGPGIRLVRHQVPILGRSSVLAARAALAASLQGVEPAFSARLIRTSFQPTDSYLMAIAKDIGADPARLLTDMDSAEVSHRLAVSRGLFQAFGFFGTPGLVVGHTAVAGEIAPVRLRALVDLEAAGPPVCG